MTSDTSISSETMTDRPAFGTRAVVRQIEPTGEWLICPHCDDRVKFTIRQSSLQRKQVICNIYVDGRWDHVEFFHAVCYAEAGQPHGIVFLPEAMPT